MKDEFDAFLECGILAHGFLRLRCSDCGHDKLVAFSCKRQGFCPSCMAQTAAHLVHPHVPVRQWVLSLPIPLRLLLAAQPKLVTPVRRLTRAAYQIEQAVLASVEVHLDQRLAAQRTDPVVARPQAARVLFGARHAVAGQRQARDGSTHLIARRLVDMTPWLGALASSSRDFY